MVSGALILRINDDYELVQALKAVDEADFKVAEASEVVSLGELTEALKAVKTKLGMIASSTSKGKR